MIKLCDEQIANTAEVVKLLRFKASFYERPFIKVNLPEEQKLRLYFFSVGICHQTYQLANSSMNLYGWDYLEYGFLKMIESSPALFEPTSIASSDSKRLIDQISTFFAPEGDLCTLDRMQERVALYQDMAAGLLRTSNGSVYEIISSCSDINGNISTLRLYEKLKAFEAYRDPLNKKSSFFIKLAIDAGLIKIADAENLVPVMDYHMQRILLRTGCVIVEDDILAEALRQRKPMESDVEIRRMCTLASSEIARRAGLNVLQMNDILYLAARSCCNEKTLCRTYICEKTPCSLSRAVELGNHSECVFGDYCKGAIDDRYHKLWQPVVKTHYY